MLSIYKSNFMENLMEALVSVLADPPDDPMVPEYIGVQSRGMRHWIDTTLADRFLVSANVRFMFLKDIVEQVLETADLSLPGEKPFSDASLMYALMDIFSGSENTHACSEVLSYLGDDPAGIKCVQVSRNIAALFDDYQVYRPDMLLEWQKPGFECPRQMPAMRWQSGLFSLLCEKGFGRHMGNRVNDFLNKPLNADDLFCPRLFLFGISSMPPLFMTVLSRMAQAVDVHLFLLTPSKEFFGHIMSPKKQALVEPAGSDLYLEAGNPLLAAMGRPAQTFQMLMENTDYHEPLPDLFVDPLAGGSNMLHVIQSDILNLADRTRDPDYPPLVMPEPDDTIGLHACHTAYREAQVLKDQLMAILDRHPDMAPHDIIVMMPDIESYSPYIDAVFSDENRIPYTISDRTLAGEHKLTEAVFKMLELPRGRFGLHRVLDLLLYPEIADRFDISPGEVGIIEEMCMAAGICWGINPEDRAQAGMPADHENTWEFGLERLMLGLAMPENPEGLVYGMSPCSFLEGLDAGLLGRFAFFCDKLFSNLFLYKKAATPSQWCDRLNRLLSEMIRPDMDTAEPYLLVIQSLDRIRQNAQQASCNTLLGVEAMEQLLEMECSRQVSTASFMAGRMTFCNIMPMRSIPFKVVALMGMNEQQFPRRGIRDSFDLIRQNPRPGDRVAREEDLNLFLEALLSARRYFLVTYTGMDVKDNTPFSPSSAVTELIDTITEGFVFENGEFKVVHHPLHAFDPLYYQAEPFLGLFSYSEAGCRMAKKTRSAKISPRPFLTGPLDRALVESIDIEDLVRFFKAPLSYFMKNRLDIGFDSIIEPAVDREPDRIDGLTEYTLGSFLVDRMTGSSAKGADNFETDFEWIRAMGILPHGEKGRVEYQKIYVQSRKVMELALPVLEKSRLPRLDLAFRIEDTRITGTIPLVNRETAFQITYARLTPRRILAGWLYHLLLNLAPGSPEIPDTTCLIGRKHDDAGVAVQIRFPGIKKSAPDILKNLVQAYRDGLVSPFVFFPDTAWQYVTTLMKTADPLDKENRYKAFSAAGSKWRDDFRRTGEGLDRYARAYFAGRDLFEDMDMLHDTGFADNAIQVFSPVLDSMEILT